MVQLTEHGLAASQRARHARLSAAWSDKSREALRPPAKSMVQMVFTATGKLLLSESRGSTGTGGGGMWVGGSWRRDRRPRRGADACTRVVFGGCARGSVGVLGRPVGGDVAGEAGVHGCLE